MLGTSVRFVAGTRDLSLLKRPDRRYRPPSLLFGAYWEPFSRGYSGWILRLTPHIHKSEVTNEWSCTFTLPYACMSCLEPCHTKLLLWSSELYKMDSGKRGYKFLSLITQGHYCTLCSVELCSVFYLSAERSKREIQSSVLPVISESYGVEYKHNNTNSEGLRLYESLVSSGGKNEPKDTSLDWSSTENPIKSYHR